MIPTYTHLGEKRYLADFGGGRTVEVEVSRERSWPGLEWGEIHRPIYEHAASVLPHGCEAYDAGCGSGYGTRILRDAGCYVVGFDVDQDAVRFACGHVPGTVFEVADMAAFKVPPRGAVVCIEVIEHVERDLAALRNLYDALEGEGVLYLSTPERSRDRPKSEFHVREYEWPELRDLLTRTGFVDVERHRVTEFMESICLTARRPWLRSR